MEISLALLGSTAVSWGFVWSYAVEYKPASATEGAGDRSCQRSKQLSAMCEGPHIPLTLMVIDLESGKIQHLKKAPLVSRQE